MIFTTSKKPPDFFSRIVQAVCVAIACTGGAAIADSAGNCRISPPVPGIPGAAKTYTHTSGNDDTAAIQKALDGLQPGDWLVFPSGTYNISQHLTVLTPGVTLYGVGATIHSLSSTDGALWIKSDNVAVYGFTLQQDSTSRQSTGLGLVESLCTTTAHREIEPCAAWWCRTTLSTIPRPWAFSS